MAIKESLLDNQDFILESLPTQELKDEFLASLEKVEEPAPASTKDAVSEAQAPDHVSEDLYDGIKKDIESMEPAARMTEAEEKAAIEEALKNVPTAPE